MGDFDPNYEPEYHETVAMVQGMFAGAPTPGEVVRAIERRGWAPTEFTERMILAELSDTVPPDVRDWIDSFIANRLPRSSDSSRTGGEL